jgi:hypothetical protein
MNTFKTIFEEREDGQVEALIKISKFYAEHC